LRSTLRRVSKLAFPAKPHATQIVSHGKKAFHIIMILAENSSFSVFKLPAEGIFNRCEDGPSTGTLEKESFMSIARHLTLVSFLAGSSIFTTAALAIEKEESEADEGRIAFVYGGDCSQLAQLSRLQIQAVTHAVHAETFDRFCHAQGIYSCSDYTAMLHGAGTLVENDNFGCNFLPARR
jgi:hypothetical protein